MQLPEHHPNTNNSASKFTFALLMIYLVVLYWLLLLKLGFRMPHVQQGSINLIPFSQPVILNGRADNGEIILNILVFMPLGMYIEMLFDRWSFVKKLGFFLGMSFIIEGLQYLLRIGAFDITDIITNTFGALTGLFLFKLVAKAFNSRISAQQIINHVAAVITCLVILFLVLLKLNMLPLRYQ